MSTPSRTFNYLRKIGLKQYLIQLWYIGDTKYGKLMGVDRFGNKYYENEEELPLRTRWVDYAKHDFDAAQIEPMWHAWMSHNVKEAPNEQTLEATRRPWAPATHVPSLTWTRGAYKPYSTTQPKVTSWEPVAAQRT